MSQPLSGNSSNSAPHAAPALLTRISSFGSLLPDFRRQHLDAGHGGNIDRQRDAFAAIFRGKFFRGRLARPRLACGDVDLRRALGEKSACNHLADAARSAGYQRDAALERKQILEHAYPPLILSAVLSAGARECLERERAPRSIAEGITTEAASRSRVQGRHNLRRIDPAKTVPHRGGGAGGQDRQDAGVLIIAVERNPRQRGQVFGAFGEDHARAASSPRS